MTIDMSAARRLVRSVRRRLYPGTTRYWDRRYRFRGTSGSGSYGRYAEFKAEFLNAFVARYGIETVIELGCGDGNQLSLATYPSYVGLDLSKQAIARCEDRFAGDSAKQFRLYDPAVYEPSPDYDLALSLDVILHLVRDEEFDQHLRHLFGSSRRYAIIYGTDRDIARSETAAHVFFRRFTGHIARRFPEWTLEQTENGIEPEEPGGIRTDFFVYRSS